MLSKIKKRIAKGINDGVAHNGLPNAGPGLHASDQETHEINSEDIRNGEHNGGADGDMELEDLTPMNSEENEDDDSEDDEFFDSLDNPRFRSVFSQALTFVVTTLWKYFADQDCREETTSSFCCSESARMFWLRFTSLPLELREMVYTEMFADLPHSIVLRPGWQEEGEGGFPPIVPAFCYTNKQIFNESIPVLLHGRKLHTENYGRLSVLKRFLNKVPEEKAWRAITAIRYGESYISQHLFDLTHKCSGLRSLHMVLNAFFCVSHDENTGASSGKSISDIGKGAKCGRVASSSLKLPCLRKLTIDCIDTERVANTMGCEPAAVCENLVKFVGKERQRQSATCEIELRYLSMREESCNRPVMMGWGSEEDEI